MWIVFNPAAGAARRRRLQRAVAALPGAEVAATTAPGDAARLAQQGLALGHRVIVAAGGDGTIAEVAGALHGHAATLGILPFGTANVLAHELGLPRDAAAAARVIAAGRRAPLHPGLAIAPDGTRRLFVQMLGAGFDAAVVHALPPGLKRRLGKGAYVLQTLGSLATYRFPPLRFRADGGAWEVAAALIVTKGRFYAGRFTIAPGASPLRPGFTLLAARRGGAGATLLAAAALPLDLMHRMPFVTRREVQALEIAGEGVPVQADGEAAGFLPLRVTAASAPLEVIIP
ncbi:MAG: diacylglycerol kinase family lipid kinase [Rubritepida sp.]|jgi:diacylglycerol kinase family enzyme|nr:diacylglycerol kinase family lipid kinase [Rubritepida sp.]